MTPPLFTTETPDQVLHRVFGYHEFRPSQLRAIDAVLAGSDTVVLMPTGGGKSVCYQIPAILNSGCALVISPLISLMHDQVTALRQLGIDAEFLNSSLSGLEMREVNHRWQSGQLKLLYVSPERLFMPEFMGQLIQNPPSLIAIDEAHCISEWGHDFRPEYQQLHILKSRFSQVPIMALTATATEQVLVDIKKNLTLREPVEVKVGFNRPNLFYEVRPKHDTFKQILAFIQARRGDSGIVYCQSRSQVDSVTEKLVKAGIDAKSYHAGLSDAERKRNQDAFTFGRTDVIVATIAFGMGINKPDVRFVIHHDLPKTIENYYQETGRAGRDGADSHCVLFFSFADKHKYTSFIAEVSDPLEQKNALRKLDQMLNFAAAPYCRRKQLLGYFGDRLDNSNCGGCDICVNPPQQQDVTVLSQKVLSCIYRTGQRFGSGMITAVLRGQLNDRVRQAKFDQLALFGLCKENSDTELRDLIQYLAFIDAVRVTGHEYPILTLTETARAIFKGDKQVMMPIYIKPKLSKKKEKKAAIAATFESDLFEKLRQKRREIAEEKGVPAYVIFHDKTLKDMAEIKPKTLDEFLEVNGVGQQKAERYGNAFIQVILAH